MNIVERFLKYVDFDTQSDGHSSSCPSTDKQKTLGAFLVDEMKAMGLTDVFMDQDGYVYGMLEKNIDKDVPVVGLIAHMDTSPDFSGENVQTQFIENYDGGDIVLDAEKRIIMRVKDFPNLADYVGKTLITTDGSTLLGVRQGRDCSDFGCTRKTHRGEYTSWKGQGRIHTG